MKRRRFLQMIGAVPAAAVLPAAQAILPDATKTQDIVALVQDFLLLHQTGYIVNQQAIVRDFVVAGGNEHWLKEDR